MNIREIIRGSVDVIKKEERIRLCEGRNSQYRDLFTSSSSGFTTRYEKGREIVLNHVLPNGPLKRVGKSIATGVLALAVSVGASLLLGSLLAAWPVGVMIGLALPLSVALTCLALITLVYASLKLTFGIYETITKESVIVTKNDVAEEDLRHAKFFLFHFIQKIHPQINKKDLSQALSYELSNANCHPFFLFESKADNCKILDLDEFEVSNFTFEGQELGSFSL